MHHKTFYLHSAFYSREAGPGFRGNDPAIGIAWRAEPRERQDRKRPDLDPKFHGLELMRTLR